MRGDISVLSPTDGLFEGTLGIFGVRSNGKLKKRKIKAALSDMGKKDLTLECRSYRPTKLTVCVRPDKDSLIMFELVRLEKNGEYQNVQGRLFSSGQWTSWGCSFKMK